MYSLKLFDVFNFVCCFLLAVPIAGLPVEKISLTRFFSMRFSILNIILFVFLLLIWHGIYSLFNIYSSKRLTNGLGEIIALVKSNSLCVLSLFVIKIVFNIRMVDFKYLIVFWALICLSTITSRVLLRFVLLKSRLLGRNLKNIVFIGINSRSMRFARKIENRPELGCLIIGFFDNRKTRLHGFHETGFVHLGDQEEFLNFVRNNVVDEVVMCLPLKSFYDKASEIVALCEEQGIIFRLLAADLFDVRLAHSKTTQFDDESLITFRTGKISGSGILIKRAIDFTGSFLLIAVLSPIFFATAILIKVTSNGPVLYVQDRLGLNKRRFEIYKFRTMFPEAEKRLKELEHLNEASGPVFKIKNDPRITAVGRILRKLSIDELPQLFNVLKGDMSLVGPRPLPVRDCEGFDQDWHRRRFSVRPGITCLWQIGGRSNISFDRWMELDMEYIDNWSLSLDLMILMKTIPAVLKGSGAA